MSLLIQLLMAPRTSYMIDAQKILVERVNTSLTMM